MAPQPSCSHCKHSMDGGFLSQSFSHNCGLSSSSSGPLDSATSRNTWCPLLIIMKPGSSARAIHVPWRFPRTVAPLIFWDRTTARLSAAARTFRPFGVMTFHDARTFSGNVVVVVKVDVTVNVAVHVVDEVVLIVVVVGEVGGSVAVPAATSALRRSNVCPFCVTMMKPGSPTSSTQLPRERPWTTSPSHFVPKMVACSLGESRTLIPLLVTTWKLCGSPRRPVVSKWATVFWPHTASPGYLKLETSVPRGRTARRRIVPTSSPALAKSPACSQPSLVGRRVPAAVCPCGRGTMNVSSPVSVLSMKHFELSWPNTHGPTRSPRSSSASTAAPPPPAAFAAGAPVDVPASLNSTRR
mmetsp:Transcript_103279/g.316061  ORF Transcript_103279/g.316061 Transcript_103279/m.316061 type:complete len:355 (+) Transcript_103279:853-1917(+)